MKITYLLTTILLFACTNAHADWFLRGTHNSWTTTPMAASGTNTVEAKNVVFTSAGSVKFDRFGDWKENYGAGGFNGANIPVAVGAWNIKFYTDTKHWDISRVVQYHLRGTHNNWAEGDVLYPVDGSTTNYEACRNFGVTSNNSVPRFKVDPYGGWGADAFPSQDYIVSGWTRIVIDSNTRKIVSVATKLGADCTGPLIFTTPGPLSLRVGQAFDNPVKNVGDLKTIIYQSSNTSIARVEGSRVTVVGVGTATIRAYAIRPESQECIRTMCQSNGSYVINAFPAMSTLSFKVAGSVSLVVGNSFDNPAVGSPASGFINYSSSDTKVATVAGSVVTIVGPGVATITATESEVGSCLCGGIARYTINANRSISFSSSSYSSVMN